MGRNFYISFDVSSLRVQRVPAPPPLPPHQIRTANQPLPPPLLTQEVTMAWGIAAASPSTTLRAPLVSLSGKQVSDHNITPIQLIFIDVTAKHGISLRSVIVILQATSLSTQKIKQTRLQILQNISNMDNQEWKNMLLSLDCLSNKHNILPQARWSPGPFTRWPPCQHAPQPHVHAHADAVVAADVRTPLLHAIVSSRNVSVNGHGWLYTNCYHITIINNSEDFTVLQRKCTLDFIEFTNYSYL